MEKQLENRLNDEGYKNWLKVSQALIQLKEALHDLTRNGIEKIHGDILARTGFSRCNGTCKTNKGKIPNCSSCTKWITEIKSYYKGAISWKNTEPTKWHNDSWEIAKCFMNPQGSKATAALNTGPEKTDLSGILNVLANCKEFGRNYFNNKGHPQNVRQIRNKVMHCPNMTFSEDEMKRYVASIIALLEDDKYLKNKEICKEKVRMIKSIRDGDFKICPEAEVDCIEQALRTHELVVESGDEVDNETRQFLKTLTEFVKTNKDLENKFDLKLKDVSDRMNDVTDQFNSRMSSVERSYGELKGKIQWLETRMCSLENGREVVLSEAASSRVGQHDKSLFKNSLQCYAQKKGLGIPTYSHVATDSGKFISTVTVADREFRSQEPKSSKKEADQSAAEVALKVITNEVTDCHEEKDSASPPGNKAVVLPKVQREKNVSYKNQLQERAQEKRIFIPHYETKQNESGLFVSEIFFNGAWYSPDILPQRRKIDAEQKAAQFVLACLERPEKPATETSKYPSPPVNGNCLSSSDFSTATTEQISSKNNVKTYKSILNEYVQKCSSKNNPPDYKVTAFEGKFLCSVTVTGKTFESQSPKNSKAEAKENAAMEACYKLNLVQGTESPSDFRSDSVDGIKSSLTMFKDPPKDASTQSASNVLTDKDSQSCVDSSKICGHATVDMSEEKKTFKSKLNEYTQLLSPDVRSKYEDIKSESGFRSKVTILHETYEGDTPQSSKKEAREMAARKAWYCLNPSVFPSECLPSSLSEGFAQLSLSNNDSISSAEQEALPTNGFSVDMDKSGAPHASGPQAAFNISKTENVPISNEDYVTAPFDNESLSNVVKVPPTEVNQEVMHMHVENTSPEILPKSECEPVECASKTYRSKLNEYVQSIGSTVVPKYEDIECDSGFCAKVIVLGNTYEGTSPRKSKKEAKENAAKRAYVSLGLEPIKDHSSPISTAHLGAIAMLPGQTTKLNQNKTTAQDEEDATSDDVFAINKPDIVDKEVKNDEPDALAKEQVSNFKGLLQEEVKQSKINPKYVTKEVDGTKEFISKVFLDKRCFKGVKAKKKRDAEQNAAKVALEELHGRTVQSANCYKKILTVYHKKLKLGADFPKYGEAIRTEREMFSVVVTVAKKWKLTRSKPMPKKRDVEEALAEQAIQLLDEEKKTIQKCGTSNCRSRLNQFCQIQRNVPSLVYDVVGSQGCFSGSLCFYTVEEYESLSPQPSKNEAIERAAMSACNDLDCI